MENKTEKNYGKEVASYLMRLENSGYSENEALIIAAILLRVLCNDLESAINSIQIADEILILENQNADEI